MNQKGSSFLHVNASPAGAASLCYQIGCRLIDHLNSDEHRDVAERQLIRDTVPYPNEAYARAITARDAGDPEAHREAFATSEKLIRELEAAGTLVITTPMHNFAVPAILKSWIDQVLRRERTFTSTNVGKRGLLTDRAIFVIVTCGGRFGENGQTDFLTPYLQYALATIGLRRFSSLRLEELSRSDAARAYADRVASEWIAKQSL
jgi:FMN-dependent NADH-azoreductase